MAVICPDGHEQVQALADLYHCLECGKDFDPTSEPTPKKAKK